ncbi:MAG TPA: hypothetical protein VLX11_14515 [Candidatus Acidoferrales bacterium]|nr:hypothetical protein [Candidatus Acidoferrales bacterium]
MSAHAALCRRATTSVILLNIIFFLLVSLVAAFSTSIFMTRVRKAFSTGQLNQQVDYASYDSRTGNHQYADCVILQMLINPGENWLRRALGPRIYFQQDYLNSCDTLYRLAHDSQAARTLASFRYTRYWHGYYPISGLLLSWIRL